MILLVHANSPIGAYGSMFARARACVLLTQTLRPFEPAICCHMPSDMKAGIEHDSAGMMNDRSMGLACL